MKAFLVLLCAANLAPGADDLAKWPIAVPITMNTSAAGADVKGDVADYPVAVALFADNFDFTQAKPDGADLRFSLEKNGAPLPFAIEHFDAPAKSALIWVKVPLIKGDAEGQTIWLHVGNPAAQSATDSHAVFDLKAGFVGVWHLDEEGNTTEDGYKDATATAAHATGVNLQAGARADGRVGKGVQLKYDQTQWIKVAGDKRKAFDLTNKVTFSIWAKADSYSNKGNQATRALPGYETMFAKGDNSWRIQKFGVKSWHKPPADLIEICVEKAPRGDLCVVGKTDMKTKEWYHFVGVHDHPKARIYVNGVLDKEETFDVEWGSGDHPVGIGNQSQFPDKGRQWDGVLDEARVMNVVKDEHWIKLEYESQREGQRFLRVGKAQPK